MPIPSMPAAAGIIGFIAASVIFFPGLCRATEAMTMPDNTSSSTILIPHPDIGRGDIRSEAVASARRLLGLKDSFTRDSFARHILFVNGILEYSSLPAKTWARDLARRLKKNGILSRKGTPAAGDLIFFGLEPAAPGSINTRNVMVGVVETVRSDSLTFFTAGSAKVIRATLSLKPGRGKETRLTACTVTIEKKVASKRTTGKSSRKNSKRAAATKPTATKTTSITKQVPCKASQLFAGFADIETVVRKLGGKPAENRTITILDDSRLESLQNSNEGSGKLGKED